MDERAKKAIDDAMREVMAKADYPEATAIVCMAEDSPSHFDDDKFDDCMECGRIVRYRPYMPDLPKVCVSCAGPDMGDEA